MTGTRREFEQAVESTVHTHDDLPADVRASVLIQAANQLRTERGDA